MTASGIPGTVDLEKTKGLGLHLVNMLVQQINGKVSIARKGGTSFEIRFPYEMTE